MATGSATTQRHGSAARLVRRFTGALNALALAVLLTGNVAAYQVDREDRGVGPLVTPRVHVSTSSGLWLSRKLATTAGHRILVYG
jgi:hypothetical protein